MSYGTFVGRPPLAPLARAASALASDVTLPPFRPSATAAGFLRGTTTPLGQRRHRRDASRLGQPAVISHKDAEFFGGVATHVLASLFRLLEHALEAVGVRGVLPLQGELHLSHRRIKPYRLGYVKW